MYGNAVYIEKKGFGMESNPIYYIQKSVAFVEWHSAYVADIHHHLKLFHWKCDN